MCPWGLRCASPNVMRLLAASEINLITICKCYSCFPNRPGLTLEACIYIHTHEPKTKLNADTCYQHMLKQRYTTLFINYIKLYVGAIADLNSELKTYTVLWPVLSTPYLVLSHCGEEFVFCHFKVHTPDTSCCLVPDLHPFLFIQ